MMIDGNAMPTVSARHFSPCDASIASFPTSGNGEADLAASCGAIAVEPLLPNRSRNPVRCLNVQRRMKSGQHRRRSVGNEQIQQCCGRRLDVEHATYIRVAGVIWKWRVRVGLKAVIPAFRTVFLRQAAANGRWSKS
jgi:hypothetical protein